TSGYIVVTQTALFNSVTLGESVSIPSRSSKSLLHSNGNGQFPQLLINLVVILALGVPHSFSGT
ncbi:hypothetical protein U0070_015052, partial [Myodes glareolus]